MLTINNTELLESSTFPSGEVHIRLPELKEKNNCIHVKTVLDSSDAILRLIMVKDALDEYYRHSYITLEIAYMPYARQYNNGGADAGAHFQRVLQDMNFDHITTYDVHNADMLHEETTENIRCEDILLDYCDNWAEHVLVRLNAGARSRLTSEFQEMFKAGVLASDTQIVSGKNHIMGNDLLIVTDICDVTDKLCVLAKELKKQEPNSITLYATHGIFSSGVQTLINSGITKLVTTDSICRIEHDLLTVIEL